MNFQQEVIDLLHDTNEPPVKGWRNLWVRIADSHVMYGPVLWETKEIAERRAHEGTLRRLPGVFEYLGAFREAA